MGAGHRRGGVRVNGRQLLWLLLAAPTAVMAGALTVLVTLLSVDAIGHARKLWRRRMTRWELRNEALAEAHARLDAERTVAGALAEAVAARNAELERVADEPIPYGLGEVVDVHVADPLTDVTLAGVSRLVRRMDDLRWPR